MHTKNSTQCIAFRRAGSYAAALALAIAASLTACAEAPGIPTDGRTSSTSSSSSASSSSSGGEGGSGGSGGGGGGAPVVCEPGKVEDCYSGPGGTAGIGACKLGKRTCAADGTAFSACEGEVTPTPETCATLADDDCNGIANNQGESCICVPGAVEACYDGPAGTVGVGLCKEGTRTCDVSGTMWLPCGGQVVPTNEICGDTADEDCSGSTCATPLWNLILGGAQADQAGGVAVDSAGNVYVVGAFSGSMTVSGFTLTSAGGTDAFIAKFDPQGAGVWAQSFGDGANQGATAVAIDAQDNVIVGGYFSGNIVFGGSTYTANGQDAFVAKIGGAGSALWSKRIGNAGTQNVSAIATDSTSSFIVAGTFDGQIACAVGCVTSAGGQDIYAFKFDDQNNQTWLKVYGDASDQGANAVAVDAMNNVIIAGQIKGGPVNFGGKMAASAGGLDAYVLKLDPAGVAQWVNRYGDSLDQDARAVAVDAAGNIAVGGTFQGLINLGALDSVSKGLADIFVVKLAPDGSYQWERAYGDPSDQGISALAFDAAGGLYMTGGFQGAIDFGGGPLTSVIAYDQFLVSLTDKGAHTFSLRYGDMSNQGGKALARDPMSGDILVLATVAGVVDYGLGALPSAGMDDVAVLKLRP